MMRKVFAVLRNILIIALVLVCAALFYVLVIMGGTATDESDFDEMAGRPAAQVVAVADHPQGSGWRL